MCCSLSATVRRGPSIRQCTETPVFRYVRVSVHWRIDAVWTGPCRRNTASSAKGHRVMYARSEPADREPDTSARPPLVRELLLVVGLFVIYKLGRQAANGHVEEAFRNAGNVWDFERSVHLPGEGAVQSLLLHNETLI